MIKRITLLLFALTLGGCGFLGDQADKRLGEACTDDVRVVRATLFYDLLENRHGAEITQALVEPLAVMHESLAAEVSLDPAGDAYRLAFVEVAFDILKKEGKEVVLGGFDEAVTKLRQLPSLASGFNVIEARVGIACAKSKIDNPTSDLPEDPSIDPDTADKPKAEGSA
ncbi:hypothetical protein [uncultured Kiloniella sp.]|uniref:hypothetical protein n=1 Tax=uncultured Kiloniella sp. TaxID=1133091 RepID=UPI0026176453|nr:hypothetical protein [uncultured Kiloniella sp.]